MKSNQYILLGAALLLGLTVYFLPRTPKQAASGVSPEQNLFEKQIGEIKQTLTADKALLHERWERNKQYDSLVRFWDGEMRPGISAEFAWRKAIEKNSVADWTEAGNRFRALVGFYQGAEKENLAARATKAYEKALELAPANLDAKTQYAVHLVENTDQPMQGISMLRELVAEDSTLVAAQLNLGFFSMRSGQFEKAIQRYQTVYRLAPERTETLIFLGDAYAKAGNKQKALQHYKDFIGLTADDALIKEVNERIKQLSN